MILERLAPENNEKSSHSTGNSAITENITIIFNYKILQVKALNFLKLQTLETNYFSTLKLMPGGMSKHYKYNT